MGRVNIRFEKDFNDSSFKHQGNLIRLYLIYQPLSRKNKMSIFTNEQIYLDQMPQFEEVKLISPNAKYWSVIRINLIIFLVVLMSASLLLFYTNELWLDTLMYVSSILILILWIFLVFIYKLSFKRRGYAMRQHDLLFKSGIIAERTSVIPFNRIQHVVLDEGIFSRMLGLATLQVYTASGNSGDIKIAGLEVETAKSFKEAILERVNTKGNSEHE